MCIIEIILLKKHLYGTFCTVFFLLISNTDGLKAQTPPLNLPPSQDTVPSVPEMSPELTPLLELPPADELLGPIQDLPEEPSLPAESSTFAIERFEFINNTAFSDEELQAVTREFTGESKTFADIAAARSAVTQLYIANGYATSGAIAPPQQVIDGVVRIEIIESQLSEIVVQGTDNLNSDYVSSRITAESPLNVDYLVEQLQLLQLDPLIRSISADLQATPQPGTNRLVVSVVEADSFSVTYTLDNNRSPSVGTIRNKLQVTEANLLGFGDRLSVGYTLTSGSDGFEANYTLPINAQNGTIQLAANISDNEVIEEPFDVLEIDSDSNSYELSLRQPLQRSPTEEFAIGLTASHEISQTFLGLEDIGPFPLSRGADDEGRTRVSALRFFQEWTQRSPKHALALRSQFNIGLDLLDATINEDEPDSRFFSWQGQSQWVRVFSPNTLLVLRGNIQIAANPLLNLEQLPLGGQSTVRGYRENLLSTDSGILASAEIRLPLWDDPASNSLLQIAPFLDAGYGWNLDQGDPDPLASVGIGLLFRRQNLTARLDWGIPLTDIETGERNSLQENGLYFTFQYSFF